jgi:DNA-binding CsgD family transcriptional regulator
VPALARRLLEQVRTAAAPATVRTFDGELHEVLLDLQIDGIRCLLVRDLPRDPRAHLILSPREREIARMVAMGYPNKTIATVLDISAWTVCTYIRRVFAKVGVGTRAAMVARLSEEGLLKDQCSLPRR